MASTTTSPANAFASLPGLPTELLEQIAEQTSTRADLKALRLTCSNVASKTQRVYAQRLFEQQAYFLNCLESIEIGLALSKHHAFAPVVKEICFLVEDVRYLRNSSSPLSQATKSTAKASAKRTRYLQELLSNLKRFGKPEAIRTTDMTCPGPRPVKMPDVNWRAKYRKWDCWGIMNQSPVRIISSAMPRGMRLDSFCTDATKWKPRIASLDYMPFFENLQHLELDVSNSDHSKNLAQAIAGSRIPQAARRLKTLRVGVDRFGFSRRSRYSSPGLIELLISENMPCLEDLTLRGGNGRCQDFFNFIKRHRKLKEIILDNLWLHDLATFHVPGGPIEGFMAEVFPGFDAKDGFVEDFRIRRDCDSIQLTFAAFNVDPKDEVRVSGMERQNILALARLAVSIRKDVRA